MDERPELDLAQTLQATIKAEGFEHVFFTAPNSREYSEFVCLSFGTPRKSVQYYDFTEDIPVRVTVLCKRISELDAMNDAMRIADLLTYNPLESGNGSFLMSEIDVERPRPMVWDESGRFVWVFDVEMSIERTY